MKNLKINFHEDIDYKNGCEELLKKNNPNRAIIFFQECVKKNKNVSEYWTKLGIVYFLIRDLKKAKHCFMNSIRINPQNALSLMNLGVVNYELSNYKKAITYFKKSFQEKKLNNRSMIYLSIINLTKQFSQNNLNFYENFRDKSKLNLICDHLKVPELKLDDFFSQKTKKILIFNSEGFGDHLMFSRYLNVLNEYNFESTLLVDNSIIDVFQNLNLYNIEILSKLEKNRKFDFVLDALSLPNLTKKKFKYPPPALSFNKQFLNSNLPEDILVKLNTSKKKIGVAWSGNKNMPRNEMRSIPIKDFCRIFKKYKNKVFFVLQTDLNNDEKKEIKKYNNVFICQNYLDSFSQTIKIANKMDEFITICTSLVHIAGSLAKPTKLILSKVPDWRWGLNKKKSIWYKNIQILRQKEIDKWDSVIEQI